MAAILIWALLVPVTIQVLSSAGLCLLIVMLGMRLLQTFPSLSTTQLLALVQLFLTQHSLLFKVVGLGCTLMESVEVVQNELLIVHLALSVNLTTLRLSVILVRLAM